MSSGVHFEATLVATLATSTQSLANIAHFILDTAFPYPEHPFGQDVWVAANVPREVVGLSPGLKPGDIDLLIVPEGPSGPHVEKTMAVEVKVVRPTFAKPSRNANSYGRSQASGLLRDGFPFVGLLHLVLPEPLPSEYLVDIPHVASHLGPNGEFVLTGETSQVDFFPIAAAERQHLRLQALNVSQEVAFASIGIQLSQNGTRLAGNTYGDTRAGCRNANVSPALLEGIRAYMLSASMSKIVWHPK